MPFSCLPVLDTMEQLYEQARNPARFKAYLAALQQGSKGDMQLPIAGFNPMAKEQVLAKLQILKQLNAEQIVAEVAQQLTADQRWQMTDHIQITVVLADDLLGGWTNRYTTDFDSKFKLNAFVERNFCTPHFWTSESYTAELIQKRTLAQSYRTIFWKKREKRLYTLADHFEQELFVQQQLGPTNLTVDEVELSLLNDFYQAHHEEDNYALLFNFFYGDDASNSLSYPTFGIGETNGFVLAAALAHQRK